MTLIVKNKRILLRFQEKIREVNCAGLYRMSEIGYKGKLLLIALSIVGIMFPLLLFLCVGLLFYLVVLVSLVTYFFSCY